jgi:splicing factor 45
MSNSSNQTPPSRGGGLSLYANLLDPDSVTSSATVSKGPVVFKHAESTDEASAKKPSIDPGS